MYSGIVLIYNLLIFDLISCSITFMRQKLLSVDDLLICKLQPNGYACREEKTTSKFYFDTVLKTCSTFEYGECDFSKNQFDTLHECNTMCFKSLYQDFSFIKNLTTDLICHLQPDFGDCYKYYPMYYFDVSTHACKGFSYSGCGGNGNRFMDEMTCKNICTDWLPLPMRVRPDRTLSKPIETILEDSKPVLTIQN